MTARRHIRVVGAMLERGPGEYLITQRKPTASLPLLWHANFLLGPKTASGEDTYVLCEINLRSVYPFPDEALEPLVRTALERLRQR